MRSIVRLYLQKLKSSSNLKIVKSMAKIAAAPAIEFFFAKNKGKGKGIIKNTELSMKKEMIKKKKK